MVEDRTGIEKESALIIIVACSRSLRRIDTNVYPTVICSVIYEQEIVGKSAQRQRGEYSTLSGTSLRIVTLELHERHETIHIAT